MKTIYLAGPLSDGDNPYAWHESIQAYETTNEWVNPFVLHDEGATGDEIWSKDLASVRESDAVLLRRIDGYEVCEAYIEAGVAGEHDIPIVVWNDADTEPPEALRWHADSVHETMEAAIDEVVQICEEDPDDHGDGGEGDGETYVTDPDSIPANQTDDSVFGGGTEL